MTESTQPEGSIKVLIGEQWTIIDDYHCVWCFEPKKDNYTSYYCSDECFNQAEESVCRWCGENECNSGYTAYCDMRCIYEENIYFQPIFDADNNK